jgi:hypothetical protein
MTRAKSHVGMEGGNVAEALRVLRRDSAPVLKETRDSAAQVLMAEMTLWAPSVVWKAFGRQLRGLPTGEAESLIADAVQSLAVVATTSTSYFRGDEEASARAWCRRVLLSHVSSELRARGRLSHVDLIELTPEQSAIDETDAERTGIDSVPSAELVQAVSVLRTIRARVFATHRRRDAETTMRAVFCYIAYLSGATLDEQVRSLDTRAESEAGAPDDAATRRLPNRVYKLRERGRRALRSIWLL